MKIFLSHAAADGAVAAHLKASFEDVGVSTFMLPDDAPAGSDWMDQIRLGLKSSSELLTLITPNALNRPWIAAEWASFWQNGLPTTPLLLNVELAQVWEPMKRSQAVNMLVPQDVNGLLRLFAKKTGVQPTAGVLPLARAIVSELPEIILRAKREDVTESINRLSTNVRGGTENIDEEDVFSAIDGSRIHDLVNLATSDSAAPVKQRQIAVAMVKAGRAGEAYKIATCIHNKNEIKNIAFALLETTHPNLGEEAEEWIFLKKIFEYLGKPQRRNVRERMITLGLYPFGPWVEEI